MFAAYLYYGIKIALSHHQYLPYVFTFYGFHRTKYAQINPSYTICTNALDSLLTIRIACIVPISPFEIFFFSILLLDEMAHFGKP